MASGRSTDTRPNVLLVTADQQKASTLGCFGDPLGATPNLDRLAGEGTLFRRCRTQNPFCQPSRATILTGQYPSTHGVIRNGVDLPLEAEQESVAHILAGAGYRTALFGKAHFASYYPDFPTGRSESVPDASLVPPDWHGPYFGFEHVELVSDVHNIRLAPAYGLWNWGFGPPPMGLHYGRYLFRDGRTRGLERLRLLQPEAAGCVWDHTQTWPNQIDVADHHTTWVTDRALEWIDAADAPFFCWVSFADPHHPFDPPEPWSSRYRPEDMAEVRPVSHPDEFVGKPWLHELWTQGFRGGPLAWTNPGWARLEDAEQLRVMAAYWGMVAQIDHGVGRILDHLATRGLDANTLVIFATDHGDYMGDHQMMLKGPMHYEALVRVPLVVRGPGFAGGREVDDPVGTIDICPTVLDVTGVDVPGWVEGRTLRDLPREHVLTEDDILPPYLRFRTLTTREWRITASISDDDAEGELYDLASDPGELHNLWSDPGYQDTKTELLATLDDVMRHDYGRVLPQVCSAG
ncbi:MAG: sulfatase-like hydrolase/transferase [Acidimicrobiia bacterium]|nr:sulfatase-like hydrolase/transferase [Acidimicrobiia bacterium]